MSIPEDDELDFSSTAPAPAAEPEPRRFRSLGGGRYEEIDCPTGRCPRVHVSELPFERQLDESDDAYAARLRTRARTATDLGNRDELYAIIGALQTDVGIPSDGITVPCRDQDEWNALAFLQGVDPDAWQYAELEQDLEHLDHDEWFSDTHYTMNLRQFLREKLSYHAESGAATYLFVGPDGFLRYTQTLSPTANAPAGFEIIDRSGSTLRVLIKQLTEGMGLTLAGMSTVPNIVQRANLETTEPPVPMTTLLLWEFEDEMPPSEADHGENIILAQNGPINGNVLNGRVRGPLNQPSTRPQTSVGASNAQPRPMAHVGTERPPRTRARLPQFVLDRFARGNRNEARTLDEFGLTKNRRRVTSRDDAGNRVHTYPDAMPDGKVVDVKDVRILANTRQLQAQSNYAKDNNRQHEIYIGPSTSLTGTMQGKVDRGELRVIRVPYLGLGDQ